MRRFWIALAVLSVGGCAGTPSSSELMKAQFGARAEAAVRACYEALAQNDYEKLSAVMRFDAEAERANAREAMPLTQAAVRASLDLDRPVYLVLCPAQVRSGEYLFLLPGRQGYVPKKIMMVNAGGEFSVRYMPSLFVRAEDLQRTKSAAVLSRELVEKEIRKCRDARGTELVRVVQEYRRRLQELVAVCQCAERNGVVLLAGYPSRAEAEARLREFSALAPEQAREKILIQLQAELGP